MLHLMTGIGDVETKTARLIWDWAGWVSRVQPKRWVYGVVVCPRMKGDGGDGREGVGGILMGLRLRGKKRQ